MEGSKPSIPEDDKDSCVRVALRIRPQVPREVIDMCRVCTKVTPNEPQVVLGADKAFTFDYVFDMNSFQSEIYERCVERLVDGALRGYNATVLAYGQTGSGKTFTMGTGFDREISENMEGIIPRAVRHLFNGIDEIQNNPYDENGVNLGISQFSVAAQFMELYNEEIIDLLNPFNKTKMYKIHEDSIGGISVSGATIRVLTGPQDAMRCLQQGALARTTASTQMNAQSSRSHALFTILIRRQRVMPESECGMPEGDLETLNSKFHFVDLAGSERLKRTGATGERAREGISINCGLLALGNVISALGDKSKKALHVPYRDSKLTRLLQDSLGGNSQTLMIACVSPSDRDFMETLNTLKYANRARNIKNKVQINQDQNSRTISNLRHEIAALQLELLEYKQGKRDIDPDGNSTISDTFQENALLLADNKRLQQRLKAMQETITALTERNAELLAEKASVGWNNADSDRSVSDLIGNYIKEIEKLQARLIESEQMYLQLKKSMNSPRSVSIKTTSSMIEELSDGPESVITLAKRELEKEREILMSRSLPGFPDNTNKSIDENENETDSGESDTDTDEKEEMEAELQDISSDIEIKSKLIEQLELSQQRMQVMRQHYEEKLNVLSAQIASTQKERDQVLASMSTSTVSNNQTDKVKKVRDEYEKKISEMHRELRKLQSAQKEHIRQQRELQQQDAQLRNLRNELSDLKSARVKLMRKISDENNRHKEVESKKAREIAQLRKEQRKNLNTIKTLQAQTLAKDQILKRRTEEVSALRKGKHSNLSIKATGRLTNRASPRNFNPRMAKTAWESLQRTIGRAARNKHAVIELERELERLLNERQALSSDLASVRNRRVANREAPELISEEDNIKANLDYIQDGIAHIHSSIMEIETGKDSSTEIQSLQTIVEGVQSVDEAKYLLEKLCESAIARTCDVALTQTRLKEREALLHEVQQDSTIQQQLLQHVLAQNPSASLLDHVSENSLANMQYQGGSANTINSSGTFDIMSDANGQDVLLKPSIASPKSSRSPSPTTSAFNDSELRTSKVRRRPALQSEMLFGDSSNSNSDKDENTQISFKLRDQTSEIVKNGRNSFIPLSKVPSAPDSTKTVLPSSQLIRQKSNIGTSSTPMYSRKTYEPSSIHATPRLSRRNYSNKASPGFDDEVNNPQTPIMYRRTNSREDAGDVFSRLGAGTQNPNPGGNIRPYNGRLRPNIPLHCTHIVEGHTNSVLSLKVCEDMNRLFTAAADRTVKVWDLTQSHAIHCLATHSGPVVAVEHDRRRNLLFSASGAYIRVWDLRVNNVIAVKTLSSSGTVLSGNVNISTILPGDSPITALNVGPSGNLYSAASDKVRIWDLRNFGSLGKLSGGHQAAVMCVATWVGPNSTDFVATGSKDHYVKVFEVPKTGGLISPLLHLEPPHYDGVQALIATKDSMGADAELFSGSRDLGLKKWDLRNCEPMALNNAHKGWVSGLGIINDILLSCCRGGVIRLWNSKTCESLAELKTDSQIYAVTNTSNRIFTASNSGEVRVWRLSVTDVASFMKNPRQ